MRILTTALILALASSPAIARAPSMDKTLAGRTPGAPTSCIIQSQIDQTTIFDEGAILYEMKSGPDYLNTPKPRCANLRSDRFIVSHTYSNQLCSGDILQLHDQGGGIGVGSCPLGDFVPYPKRKRGQ
jgi:hypothetical protein